MIPLAQTDRPMLFVLAALGMTIAFLLMRAHRYLSRQRGDDRALVEPPRPRPPGPARHLANGSAEMVQWEVEMQELARDLAAEVNSRISMLQAVTAEADRAAARLENALRKAAECSPQKPDASGKAPPEERTSAFQLSAETVYMLADYGFPCGEIAARLDSTPTDIQRILDKRLAE